MKIKKWLSRLPKGCVFSHESFYGSVFKRSDNNGVIHCYLKYDNGMVYHWISI